MPESKPQINETAYLALREKIISGELAPGAPLSERAICEELEVSRTPLREAIKMLAREGLVEISATRRARVASLSLDEAANMLTLLAALEGLSGEQACQKISAKDIAYLETLQAAMRVSHEQGDLAAYFDLNQRIHLEILRIADNKVLAEMFGNLNARLRHVRRRLNPTPGRWLQAVTEHEQILVYLKKGEGKKLRALMEDHLRNKTDVLLATMLEHGIVSVQRAG
ncbi:GntR family transcriptional regulator [Pseudomonas sp. UBA4194]|uniref:GntR family transcriptional regulator n=1 Tax=Pseudomonas sp. UBA4194 TaxID=1947317 RepID=UPI0025E38FEC|nr:GntR family transcriptional regulator [Pseudomonas sp. UBA4194]